MARGRRQDESLVPSRSLLTQRAFRERRAAHLKQLERTIHQLRTENEKLKSIPTQTTVAETSSLCIVSTQETATHTSKAESVGQRKESLECNDNCHKSIYTTVAVGNEVLTSAISTIDIQLYALHSSINKLCSLLDTPMPTKSLPPQSYWLPSLPRLQSLNGSALVGDRCTKINFVPTPPSRNDLAASKDEPYYSDYDWSDGSLESNDKDVSQPERAPSLELRHNLDVAKESLIDSASARTSQDWSSAASQISHQHSNQMISISSHDLVQPKAPPYHRNTKSENDIEQIKQMEQTFFFHSTFNLAGQDLKPHSAQYNFETLNLEQEEPQIRGEDSAFSWNVFPPGDESHCRLPYYASNGRGGDLIVPHAYVPFATP